MRSSGARRRAAPRAPWPLRIAAWCALLFLHAPIVLLVVYAFNTEEAAFSFPPRGFTTRWFATAFERADVLVAIALSLRVAALATAGAVGLGTLAALAMARRAFWGKDLITLAFILPIALPGIITGIALHSAFRLGDVTPGFWTIAIGHTTFCVVVVYNNVVARLRRLPASMIEAAMDLGASGLTAFRTVVLPQLATALLAGGILAFGLSLRVALAATAAALVLGTLAALALARRRFAGKDLVTLAFILPIALPGIITGIALHSAFRLGGVTPGFWTIAIGHATFCVVVVYNNAVARLRRMPASLLEAAMDLGANSLTAFRTVVLPQLATALLAGGILAFGLSFDELIVTTFTAGHEQTLPIWLLNQLGRPRAVPVTNVVAMAVMVITALPIVAAWWLTRGTEDISGSLR